MTSELQSLCHKKCGKKVSSNKTEAYFTIQNSMSTIAILKFLGTKIIEPKL